jgi:hypothetical protein
MATDYPEGSFLSVEVSGSRARAKTPALEALVRLLARQAARDWVEAQTVCVDSFTIRGPQGDSGQ